MVKVITKCHFCNKGKAEIPIQDGETGEELWICEKCDLELYDARTLAKKMEKAINVQIKHHRKEANIPAINSLEYLKEVLLKGPPNA